MSSQVRTQQFVRSAQFVPGGVVTLEIPRMADIETLQIALNGGFTYPAAAAGSLASIGPQALIQRVELVCDGKITVLSAPAWAFGIASDRTFEGNGGGAYYSMTTPTANAAGVIDTCLFVDLMQFDGFRPKDSNLRVRSFSNVELKITFGTWDLAFTNPASVPSVYNIAVSVDGNFCTETDLDGTKPKFVVKRTSQTISAVNTNSNYQVNLPAGNALRSVKFYTRVNNVASDTILNTVTASNGLDTRIQGTARALRNRIRGYKTAVPGMLEIDFARQTRDGVLASNAWAVPSPSQPVLTLDFNGVAGGVIEMVITEYVGA
jgi:hypothetical protein